MSLVGQANDTTSTDLQDQSQDSQVSNSISSLGLSDQESQVLEEFLANSGMSDADQQAFVSQLGKYDLNFLVALIGFLESNNSMEPDDLIAMVKAFDAADPIVQKMIGDQGMQAFEVLAQAQKVSPEILSELLDALAKFDPADTGGMSNFLSYAKDLLTVMSGGTVSPPQRQEAMELYASAPSPLNALQTDFKNLAQLNAGFQGPGEFGMSDFHKLGLSAASGGTTDANIANAVTALQSLGESAEFISIDDVMNFVDRYEAAGGRDVPGLLGQFGEIDAGIENVKGALGIAADDGLSTGYESYLMGVIAEGAANGNLQGAIDAEVEKIGATYKGEAAPLGMAASMAYQTSGFKETNIPVDLGGPKAGDNEFSGPHPGSGQNTGTVSETTDIVFPPLTEYGFDDVSESPLYSEAELQTHFNGDVKAYAEYIAQAHFLLEDPELGLGFLPEDYDGDEGDPLTQAEVKNYLVGVGYKKETIAQEVMFIKEAKGHFQKIADEKGEDGSQNSRVDSFDAETYVKSGGTNHKLDLPGHVQRPQGRFPTHNIFPQFVTDGLGMNFRAHSGKVQTAASALDFNRKEQDSHSAMTSVLNKAAQGEGGDDAVLDDSSRTEFKEAYEDRLRYGNMQEFVSSNHKTEDQEGTAEFYNSDGTVKMAVDETGAPILGEGPGNKPLTVLELTAITKYASPEMLDELIPEHEKYKGVLGMEENGGEIKAEDPDLDSLKTSLREYRNENAVEELDIDNVKKVAHLKTGAFEKESGAISAIGETLTKEMDKANGKLDKYNEFVKQIMDLYTARFDDILKLLKSSMAVV